MEREGSERMAEIILGSSGKEKWLSQETSNFANISLNTGEGNFWIWKCWLWNLSCFHLIISNRFGEVRHPNLWPPPSFILSGQNNPE